MNRLNKLKHFWIRLLPTQYQKRKEKHSQVSSKLLDDKPNKTKMLFWLLYLPWNMHVFKNYRASNIVQWEYNAEERTLLA